MGDVADAVQVPVEASLFTAAAAAAYAFTQKSQVRAARGALTACGCWVGYGDLDGRAQRLGAAPGRPRARLGLWLGPLGWAVVGVRVAPPQHQFFN